MAFCPEVVPGGSTNPSLRAMAVSRGAMRSEICIANDQIPVKLPVADNGKVDAHVFLQLKTTMFRLFWMALPGSENLRMTIKLNLALNKPGG